MSSFLLKIYTTERPLYEGECESLIVPASDGPYGVLAHHIDTIASIVEGELRFKEKGKTDFERVAVSSGILNVTNNEVLVLTDTAEWASEIDVERAKKQYEHAKEKLEAQDEATRRLAKAKLSRASNRIRIRLAQMKK